MPSVQQGEQNGSALTFLVERYMSSDKAADLPVSARRLARLCAGGTDSATGVRYLYSAYLPSEDTCFCLFGAASAAAVRAVNHQADFALDRITSAVLLLGV
jgi:hypothetical protein